ncbi:MAG: ribonuclease P protein component [Planctomycetota bacterium]
MGDRTLSGWFGRSTHGGTTPTPTLTHLLRWIPSFFGRNRITRPFIAIPWILVAVPALADPTSVPKDSERRVALLVILWTLLAIAAVVVLGLGILSLTRRLRLRLGRGDEHRVKTRYVPASMDPAREPFQKPRKRVPKHPYAKRNRLSRSREFDAVFQAKNSAAGRYLILFGIPNGRRYNRLGLSVGRRLGNAVVRNRFKRLCREAFRLSVAEQPSGWDWIVVPIASRAGSRPRKNRWRFDEIRSDLLFLMERISRRRRS